MQAVPRYAGFWRRLGACMIDALLFGLLLALLQRLLGGGGMWLGVGEGMVLLSARLDVLHNLLALVLTVFLWVRFMGTPGKLLLGCHVVDARSGRPLGMLQAVWRYLAYLASLLPLGLGFLWIAWDRRKQGFHDKLARSVVVREPAHWPRGEEDKSLRQLLEELR